MTGRRHCPACGAESDGPETHVCRETKTVRARLGALGEDPLPVVSDVGPKRGDLLAGRYEILAKAGEGGGGMVFRARDRELDIDIAVKVLLPGTVSEPMVKRFKREIRITREIDHPNVSRVFDLGEATGFTFLTMRWVDGEPLHRRVRRAGPLSARELHRLAAGLVDALAAAHRIGFVHRDVKPANVLVSESGEPVLVDFGIATDLDRSPSDAPKKSLDRITLDGQIPGTPAYMAPEQVSGQVVTAASDLWSLALTLSFAATGEVGLPSDAEKAFASFVRPLRAILVRCLAADPSKRPRDAVAIQRELAARAQRRRLLRTGAVAVAIALVAAVGGFFSGTPGADEPPLVHVAVLDNRTGDRSLEWLEHGVSDLVAARFETSGRVRLALDESARANAARVEGRITPSGGRPTVELVLRAPGGEVRERAKVSPPSGDALFRGVDAAVARFLTALGVPGASAASVAALPRPDTNDPVAWTDYAHARELIRQHKEREALDSLRSATARDPTFALAQLELHVLIAYAHPGPASEGEEALRLAREHRDRLLPDQRAFVDAVLETRTDDPDPKKYDRLLAYLRSHPAETWRYQTAYRVYMDEPRSRLPFLREWIARLPQDPEPYNQLGYLYFQALHDARAAEDAFKTYIRIAPTLANGHDSYAEFLRHEGRLDEAQVEFDRALAIDPLFANSAFGAIDVAIRRDDLVDAERRLARGRAAVPPAVAQFENWVDAYLATPILRGAPEETDLRIARMVVDPVIGSRAYVARQYEAILLGLRGDGPAARRAADEADRLRMLYQGVAAGPSALGDYAWALAAYRAGDRGGIEDAIASASRRELAPIERQYADVWRSFAEGLALRLAGDPSAAAERLRGTSPVAGVWFLSALERARALVEAGRPGDAVAAYDEAIRRRSVSPESPEAAALWRDCLREAAALSRRLGQEPKAAALEARLEALSR